METLLPNTSNESTASTASEAAEEALRHCDIVMKGGITSGVLYPPAVHELSKEFRFKNIGGTSAGAIAAALTAAAEHWRYRESTNQGFEILEQLPRWLGQTTKRNSNLFSLFQPHARARGIFRIITAGIGTKRMKWLRVVLTAIYSFPLSAALGALPGLILLVLAYRSSQTGFSFYWTIACALLLTVGVSVLVTAYAVYRRAIKIIPENYYGICSGYAQPRDNAPQPLTTWLSQLINKAAGRPENGPPLTFGDLWGTRDPDAERVLNLEMLTTSLSHGRPYRLPFIEKTFYFHPEEFRALFPEEVVKWMIDHPRETDNVDEYIPLRPLPEAADLPLIFATRLSLSFPILLSAIPLYSIDYSRTNGNFVPERCWFSDGGITSNFPVHFFDQTIPRRSAFALNLRGFHPDHPEEAIWMPEDNGGGIIEWWTRFDGLDGSKRLFGFFGSLFDTMGSWADNSQAKLPGYRDRVVHISLNDNEGGLNLNMPRPLIDKLGNRGRDAAKELTRRYTGNPEGVELTWDNHRWVRYRSTMSLMEEMLMDFEQAFEDPAPGDRRYEELIMRKPGIDPPDSYPWEARQQDYCRTATNELLQLAKRWREAREQDPRHSFGGKVPKPSPEFRIRPRL